MDDRYPSTDEQQSVHLDYPTRTRRELNRGCPWSSGCWPSRTTSCCSSWTIAALFAAIGAWFAILFTGRYPRGLFEFIEGVIRWHNRVIAYALLLITDRYPPFSLDPRGRDMGEGGGLRGLQQVGEGVCDRVQDHLKAGSAKRRLIPAMVPWPAMEHRQRRIGELHESGPRGAADVMGQSRKVTRDALISVTMRGCSPSGL